MALRTVLLVVAATAMNLAQRARWWLKRQNCGYCTSAAGVSGLSNWLFSTNLALQLPAKLAYQFSLLR